MIEQPTESAMLLHKGFEPFGTLAISCDGKNHHFTLNRRQIFMIAAQAYTALGNMEPGPWRRAEMEAA